LNIKTALLITLITLIIIIREIKKNTNPILSFPELGARMLESCQQLPGSTRKSWAGLSSRQELDSGMHGSESGARTSSESSRG